METCYRFLYAISFAVRQTVSNCKTNELISLLKSPHGVCFENVYIYSISLQQPKYRYLKNLLAPIKEIILHTLITVILYHRARLPNSIFIFDDVACDKQDAIREYFSMRTHADVDSCPFMSVRHMQRYQSILYVTTQIS